MNTPLFFTSSKGIYTCKINGKLLHSSYNPYREAQQIITQQFHSPQNKTKTPKIFVLVGAAMGYENSPILKQYPDATIISIYLHKSIYTFAKETYNKGNVLINNKEISFSKNMVYYYNNTHIYSVLLSFLRPFSFNEIIILHWNPSLAIWTKESREVLKIIKEILELLIAEQTTETFFIKRWLLNSVFHYKNIKAIYAIEKKSTFPVVVVGAGHTLLDTIPYLKSIRSHIIIIATSSSLECLYENNIIPDIIMYQDASFYAQKHMHIHYFLKKNIKKTCPSPIIAMPISAARTYLFYKKNEKILLLHTNDFPETLLSLNNLHTRLSHYATVMGTAIELAWNITKNTVYIVGFDVSADIYGAHCYPHTNYSTKRDGTRTNTIDTITRKSYTDFQNVLSINRYNLPIKQNHSLSLYEKWFTHWKDNRKKDQTAILVKNKNVISHILTMNFPIQTKITINSSQKYEIQRIFLKKVSHNYNKKTLQEHIHTWESVIKKTSSLKEQNTINKNIKNTILRIFKKQNPNEQAIIFQHLKNLVQ